MKKLAASLLLLTPMTFAQPPEASVTGKWNVHSAIAGNENDSVCAFIQKDADLSGSCRDEQGEKPITGKVAGNKVSWSYKSEYNGTTLTITYVGKLDGGKIVGDTTVDPFGVSGEFSAALDSADAPK